MIAFFLLGLPVVVPTGLLEVTPEGLKRADKAVSQAGAPGAQPLRHWG